MENTSFLLIFKDFLLVLLRFICYNELLKTIIRNYAQKEFRNGFIQ